ncbi:hypothetical protein GQ607_013815 [Colletotrichum asianum]|uniref:Uncharacterized protein n=1 Tax=Colletotrichum asianum TaxID=702518 RepID=A0A8H3VYP7_9PEZI|nr:hypothetical protein GQ607_013815 [Colletotrichum asianum]
MSNPLNFGDMSTDDFLQLLTYTNSTPPVETSKPSPRQDYLGYASLPSYPTNSTATLDYPSTSTQQPPNKTETWAGYATNPPPGYGQVPVDSAEKRNILASLDRIEAVIEWIHDSQSRQDARLTKLEDKLDEIKEELAEVNQHLTEQEMNCSRCGYDSGDESDDATEDDLSENAANGEVDGSNDYESHEFCNMYDLY